MSDFSGPQDSASGRSGIANLVFALMLVLPATLLSLVALLAITAGLERQLAGSVHTARVGADRGRVPTVVTKRR